MVEGKPDIHPYIHRRLTRTRDARIKDFGMKDIFFLNIQPKYTRPKGSGYSLVISGDPRHPTIVMGGVTITKPPGASTKRCGAHSRSTGKPCRAMALANGRCRNHGGMSTGPKTPEGKVRALANLKQYQQAT